MSRRSRPSLLLASFLIVSATVRADDTPLAKQRQTADAIAKSLQLSSIVTHETKNLIVLGTISDAKLKALGATLEKQYAAGVKALQFATDDPPWSGKLAVYVFNDRADYRSFVRQVEKRSPDEPELGSFRLSDEIPHAAAGPGKGKDAPTMKCSPPTGRQCTVLRVWLSSGLFSEGPRNPDGRVERNGATDTVMGTVAAAPGYPADSLRLSYRRPWRGG